MKPLSFEEWYEKETGEWPYKRDDDQHEIEAYAQYHAKLAWDEAAKAQRKSDHYFLPCTCDVAYKDRDLSDPSCPQCSFRVIDNKLVEYKETL